MKQPIKPVVRSPLFYVGDKYKLMPQLLELFPDEVNNFYEPFVGGGTVFLNVCANQYFLNDVNKHLIGIHKYLLASAKKPAAFFDAVERVIDEYKLSCSYMKDIVPDSLKREFKKTYYAVFNKEGYNALRDCVNNNQQNDPLILYILLIYGFNRMLRFNGNGKFNLPVGNVDFNHNVVQAINNYFGFVGAKKVKFSAKCFRSFFKAIEYAKNDFVYLDPPYLIAASEYNKLWDEQTEAELLSLMDALNSKGVKFALSNITHYNGSKNDLLLEWMGKYNAHRIQSNYINYHNNLQKEIKEVLITNY